MFKRLEKKNIKKQESVRMNKKLFKTIKTIRKTVQDKIT